MAGVRSPRTAMSWVKRFRRKSQFINSWDFAGMLASSPLMPHRKFSPVSHFTPAETPAEIFTSSQDATPWSEFQPLMIMIRLEPKGPLQFPIYKQLRHREWASLERQQVYISCRTVSGSGSNTGGKKWPLKSFPTSLKYSFFVPNGQTA